MLYIYTVIDFEIESTQLTLVTSNSRTLPLILSANAAVNEIVFDRLCASCVIICNAGLEKANESSIQFLIFTNTNTRFLIVIICLSNDSSLANRTANSSFKTFFKKKIK